MRLSSFAYFIKESLRSLWMNRLMSVASVGVLGACLILMGCVAMLSTNIASMIDEIQKYNEIMVFIDESYSETEIEELGGDIRALMYVADAEFVSNEKLMAEFQDQLGDKSYILDNTGNFLRHAYRIILTDNSKISEVLYQLRKIEGIAHIREYSDIARKLSGIRRAVNLLGIWVICIMAVVSAFIISNTIKLTVFARSREIAIMKSIGATDWFVQWPFIIEGLLIGLMSAVAAFALQCYIYINIFEDLLGEIEFLKPVPLGEMTKFLLPGILAAGIAVGAVGSAMSVRRYLRSSEA